MQFVCYEYSNKLLEIPKKLNIHGKSTQNYYIICDFFFNNCRSVVYQKRWIFGRPVLTIVFRISNIVPMIIFKRKRACWRPRKLDDFNGHEEFVRSGKRR